MIQVLLPFFFHTFLHTTTPILTSHDLFHSPTIVPQDQLATWLHCWLLTRQDVLIACNRNKPDKGILGTLSLFSNPSEEQNVDLQRSFTAGCEYGDQYATLQIRDEALPCPEWVARRPSICYVDEIREACCGSCAAVFDASNPGRSATDIAKKAQISSYVGPQSQWANSKSETDKPQHVFWGSQRAKKKTKSKLDRSTWLPTQTK